jgi:hypothetical protein
MQIQINTSNGIENKDTLERWADAELRQTLARFAVEVTLAVSHHASGLDEAFRGAAEKLKRALDSTLGRLYGHRDRDSIRKDGDAVVE